MNVRYYDYSGKEVGDPFDAMFVHIKNYEALVREARAVSKAYKGEGEDTIIAPLERLEALLPKEDHGR